jgi:hypothetical protein
MEMTDTGRAKTTRRSATAPDSRQFRLARIQTGAPRKERQSARPLLLATAMPLSIPISPRFLGVIAFDCPAGSVGPDRSANPTHQRSDTSRVRPLPRRYGGRELVAFQNQGNPYFVGDMSTLQSKDGLTSVEDAARVANDMRDHGGPPARAGIFAEGVGAAVPADVWTDATAGVGVSARLLEPASRHSDFASPAAPISSLK